MAEMFSSVIATTLTFAFALVSLTFSILALTSRKWALRHHYDPNLSDLDWVNATYTQYRSPFKICNAFPVSSNNAASAQQYTQNCTHFKAYGFDKTSCELAIATQSDGANNIGDARLCQQIHLAGNFGIASSTFVGLGFLVTLALVASTFLNRPSTSQHHPDRGNVEESEATPSGKKKPEHRKENKAQAIFAFINLMLVVFLAIAVITGLISQFYGILGFIQSMPNNSDFSSSRGQDVTDLGTHGDHGPWIQGKALSVYLTCAWGFGLATIGMASITWRLPRLKVF
jgi:hypothetical protein